MGEPYQLWIVVDSVSDRDRRRRVREVLRFNGWQVRSGVIEIVTTDTRMEAILQEIACILDPEDELRVYRVCAHCRESSVVFGDGHLSGPPVALVV